jgi:hypothetical protein
MDNAPGHWLACYDWIHLRRNICRFVHRRESAAKPMKAGGRVKAKVEKVVAEFRIWCERCCIRLAPNEERTVIQGKTYHTNCYSKVSAEPKN